MTELKSIYCKNLDNLKDKCLVIDNDNDFKELFKGVIIMLIKDIIVLNSKLLPSIKSLNTSKCLEKFSNLNILLQNLESNQTMLGFDCNDIIIRGYINYFYSKYRDDIINWNIDKIKNINENEITQIILSSTKNENIESIVSDYLNILPEIILIINCLKEREILKIFYLLNNLNIILDVYLVKKADNLLIN